MKLRWNPTLKILVAVLIFGAVIWLLSVTQAIIGPIFISILLAYLINPIIRRVRSWTRLHHTLVVSLVYIIFVVVIIIITNSFVPLIISQSKILVSNLNLIGPQVEGLFNEAANALNIDITFEPILVNASTSLLPLLQPERIFRVIIAVSTNLAWLLIILVTTFYLLLDWEKIQEQMVVIFPEQYRSDMRQIKDEISAVWQAYLRGQMVLMISVGLLTGVGATLIGLPLAVLFGLLTGALDLIPNLGPTVSLVLASLVAYFSGSTHMTVSNLVFTIITIAMFNVIQLAENLFLQPYIVGRWLKIHPGVVFIAVIGALTLGSALIALVIVPTIVSLAIIMRYIHRMLLDMEPFPKGQPSD